MSDFGSIVMIDLASYSLPVARSARCEFVLQLRADRWTNCWQPKLSQNCALPWRRTRARGTVHEFLANRYARGYQLQLTKVARSP